MKRSFSFFVIMFMSLSIFAQQNDRDLKLRSIIIDGKGVRNNIQVNTNKLLATEVLVDDDFSTEDATHSKTIQGGIDKVAPGGVVKVYPGAYNETAPNSTIRTAGTYQFGLFIGHLAGKDGITIQGVDELGNVIANNSNAVATVTTNATNNFGFSGIFVDADNVTITGLRIGNNIPGNDKTLEVVGNNFTFKYNVIDVTGGGSLYFDDIQYNSSTNTSFQTAYTIEGNLFLQNASIDITSGTGVTGPEADRKIINNKFEANADCYWSVITFNGTVPVVGWFLYPVGAATITGNNFELLAGYPIRTRGTVVGTFDWNSYFTNNTFNKAVITLSDYSTFEPQSFNYNGILNCKRINSNITSVDPLQSELVTVAVDGNTILVNDGNYVQNLSINKNITLKSVNGKEHTTITGIVNAGNLGTIQLLAGRNGVVIGEENHGFKIIGFDGPSGIENSAIYFQGQHTNIKIEGNEIVANGDAGLMTEYNAVVTNFNINKNIFSGSAFNLPTPGIGDQWTVPNVPRQLVVMGGGASGTNTTNITFTNNQIIGTTGGLTSNNIPSGNTLVTIDADNSIISGNTFNGTTTKGANFRCRRPGLTLTSNTFHGDNLSHLAYHLAIENNTLPGVMLATNTFDANVPVGVVETYPITNVNVPINFGTIGTTATFNTLPAGTPGSLTIDRSNTQPANTGTLPAGANPSLFLTIDAPGLTDHTFNVTIVLSTVGLTGFSSTTEVMYYEDGSGWVAVNGTFDATAQTYTFTTDHFTPFAFVNPTNPLAVYVTMNIANVNDNIWYNHNNADPTSDDWTYTSMPVTFYVLPVGNQGLFAADFKIKWDATKASFVSLEDGNLLSNTLKQTNIAGEVTVNAANLGSTINVTPDGQKYLAKITLNITKPGYNYVMLDNIDFRFYQNDEQTSVFATTTPGAVKMYLGDFVKDADTDVNTIGDGLVNQADLFAFAPAYWSVTAQPLFKTKFDVGPTNASGNYFAMPTPDGKIEFEDLAIFAIGYGKSANNQLPKKAEQNLLFAADAPVVNGQEIRVPITVSGNVVDLRALSMIFASNMQLVRVEKAGQLDNEMTFAAAKQENGIITFDAAVIGEQQSVNANGVIAYLVLRGQGSVSIANVIARDSYNNAIVSKANGNAVGTVPVEFSLTQNYPNPFNPSTTISYAVAKAGLVEVAIYNSLGEKVAQLVNQVQEAGNYTVEFNASRLSSGVYFYQMTAGDFSSIKKMVLMK